MTARLAGEDGFTLVELLVAMIIGVIVTFAALAVMDGSWRAQAKTADRIDTTDRGRVAMDKITQQLDSRVCLSTVTEGDTAQLVTATDSQIEFYASVTSDTAPRLVVERRRMTYRPATADILLESWTGSAAPGSPGATPPANTTTPTRSRTIAGGVAVAGTTPVFRYYVLTGTPPLPTLQRVPPIAAADRDKVVLVKVNFAAAGKSPNVRIEFQNDSQTRSPTCLF